MKLVKPDIITVIVDNNEGGHHGPIESYWLPLHKHPGVRVMYATPWYREWHLKTHGKPTKDAFKLDCGDVTLDVLVDPESKSVRSCVEIKQEADFYNCLAGNTKRADGTAHLPNQLKRMMDLPLPSAVIWPGGMSRLLDLVARGEIRSQMKRSAIIAMYNDWIERYRPKIVFHPGGSLQDTADFVISHLKRIYEGEQRRIREDKRRMKEAGQTAFLVSPKFPLHQETDEDDIPF